MSRSESARFPVTVTRLPVTRCEICGRTLAHQPGRASAVLTEHYRRMHPEALTDAADGDLPGNGVSPPEPAGYAAVTCAAADVSMSTVTLALTPVAAVTLPPAPGSSDGPVGIAALISWLLTASIGVYMLRTWIARGGLARQRATGVGVPPQVVFGHASMALTGLVVWVIYLSSGWHPLAWLGLVLVGTAITFGICTVTLWTPYPIRAEPGAAEDARFAAVSPVKTPARPDVTAGPAAAAAETAAAAEQPDAFTVTDEMIARLLAEPHGPSRRRTLHLLPLIPAVHGFAAMATFLLAATAAIGVR
jgi:hypothetical protein